MNHSTLSGLTLWLALAAPAVLGITGLLLVPLYQSRPMVLARLAARMAALGLASSLLSGLCLWLDGPVHASMKLFGPFELGLHLDSLSLVMLNLVTFLLLVVFRYSVPYMSGDPGQVRFTRWLSLTGASVLTILISGNLVQFALAWSSTSWCLHHLLVFYPDRPGARLAARKKFLVSRLGDACLLTVIVLSWKAYQTWNFAELFSAVDRLRHASPLSISTEASLIGFLLVLGAMLKSAQFPFHSWLPDTMETPTPVSALMHAGIINAGGFLILRLNALVMLSPAAMSTLALFGAFTALFASLVMLTHASIKRSLAFSTVAQMGFMMLECGVGAFSLALLHLVAHSLYKAHAFLSSGGAVDHVRPALPTRLPAYAGIALLVSLTTSLVLTVTSAFLLKVDPTRPGHFLLSGLFVQAQTHLLFALWIRSPRTRHWFVVAGISFGISLAYFALNRLFEAVFPAPPNQLHSTATWVEWTLTLLLLPLFLARMVAQFLRPAGPRSPFFQRLYVHARNGFYFNTLANRIVGALWPLKSTLRSS